MDKKVLAAAIVVLVTLNRILMAVPVNAITDPLPVLSANSGMAGTTLTVTAPGTPALAGFTHAHQVFVLFDHEVSDADLGLELFPFLAAEMYRPLIATVAGYAPGDPIYQDAPGPGAGVVSTGDVRLTPVTVGANNYAAGSTVADGDADIGGILAAFAAKVMHTGAVTGFNWGAGDGIYIQDLDNQGIPGWTRVGPADLRARYPSVTIKLPRVTRSATYAAWTKVKSPVFDIHKSVYQDIDLSGNVTVGDKRVDEVTIPQVRYAPGTFVYAEDQDAALAIASFADNDYFADADNSGHWDAGEWIHSVVGVLTGNVKVGDIRNSYVTIGTSTYLPTTPVAADDLDIGTVIRPFPEKQGYYGSVGPLTYVDWIYNLTAPAPGPIVPCAALPCPAETTVRARAIDWTNKSMAATGGGATGFSQTLPAVWPSDWLNVVGYVAGSSVALGDSDLGRALNAFAVTDRHTGAGAYSADQSIYRDNDNIVSVGDTRESIIWSGQPRAYAGPWPWPEANAPFYMPETTIAAADLPAGLIGTTLFRFAESERYYDPFSDGSYLGSDLVATGGANDLGNAAPFTATTPAFGAAPTPISFTVPSNRPAGNHVVMVITDEPPPAMVGPFLTAGFRASLPFPPGGTLPLDSLPWTGAGPVGTGQWTVFDFRGQASPAFFIIPTVCALEMSPGAYAHNLGTPASIVELDYTRSSIIQNATGDISLRITLCGEASLISIYIPPEFTFLRPDTTSVWTSITNDYRRVSMAKLSSMDPIGPLWWNLRIADSTIPVGSYVVRMFNLRAPDVFGRYFVKVFADGESIGSESFPTIVVKGNVDPAYMSGHVLNGDYAEYALPVSVSGKVIAEGMTALGTRVKVQAYFDASANGAYTLYGLAAGTYNLTASAAGFAPKTLGETISVNAGQSLEDIDIYVSPSTTISGTICSKCGAGEIPWGSAHNRTISMEILDSNLESKAWFATNKTDYDPSQAYYQFSFNGSIELDGHVPQDYAGYVSGLESGDYYLKAYVNGYLQRDVVKVHVYDYTRSVSVPFDLWRSGQFIVTVHFLSPTPKSGRLTLEAYPLDGTISGSNSTIVPAGKSDWTMAITGKRDYGLPSGTYFIEADFPGYSQTTLPQATIGEGCSTTSLSFNMVKGGVLFLTLRSVNWQTPPQNVTWRYPNATIRIEAMGSSGEVYTGTAKQQNATVGKTLWGATFANITGLPTDTYLVRVYTVGYIQTMNYPASVSSVGTSDMTVYLVEATRLDVTLEFRKEGLVADIDTYERYNLTEVPARIEVYDSLGVLVGANTIYIPHEGSTLPVEVVGFRSYAGNPCLRWINYYDTTDGSRQKDYGLPPGTYQVLVWVPGYAQAQTAILSTTPGSTAGITISLDRLAHVNGTISGLDMYEDLIPLSWATVTAYGPTLTATSSLDGVYEMWIVNGTYTLGVSSPGYEAQGVEIRASMAWEIPVDFDLRPPSGTVPELSAAELMLAVVLVIACISLRRSPPAS